MTLYTKCILEPPSEKDGIRISVMRRHTLDDGVTPHPKINSGSYDFWVEDLAPPAKLIGDYYKKRISWEEYEKEYRTYLKTKEIIKKVVDVSEMGKITDITLLCIENYAEKCHRRLLAEECKKYNPGIEIKHL